MVSPAAGQKLYRLRHQIEATGAQRGLLYPWWVPVVCLIGQLVCVLLALGMRDGLWPIGPLHVALVLVAAPVTVEFTTGRWLPWQLNAPGPLLAAALLLAFAADPQLGPMDAAPALLMFATAETTARDGARAGLVVGAVSTGLILLADHQWALQGTVVHVLTVLLGYVVGCMLLWQMRALAAEREAREAAWQQATLAERQRIAREIHDLVAHSLSVTLLHLTGARHALRDLEASQPGQPGEDTVAEVDGALADAERVGRNAMAEIRHTVSALPDGPSPTHALPGAESIETLVRGLADAGLRATYTIEGDPTSLPTTVGLGLYRIAQESLSNVAKHAATGEVTVEFSIGQRGARLLVSNELVGSDRMLDRMRGGSGLAGMKARAGQLGAHLSTGPRHGWWVVDVRVPARRLSEIAAGRTDAVAP